MPAEHRAAIDRRSRSAPTRSVAGAPGANRRRRNASRDVGSSTRSCRPRCLLSRPVAAAAFGLSTTCPDPRDVEVLRTRAQSAGRPALLASRGEFGIRNIPTQSGDTMTPQQRASRHRRLRIVVASLTAVLTVIISTPQLAGADPSPTPVPDLTPSATASSPSTAEPTGALPAPAPSTSTPSSSQGTPDLAAPGRAPRPPGHRRVGRRQRPLRRLRPRPPRAPLRRPWGRSLRSPPQGCCGTPVPVLPSAVLASAIARLTRRSRRDFTNVDGDGTWSIQTDDQQGQVNLAFYVVANFNCSDPVVSSNYLPSWYQNRPFIGSAITTAVPPQGAIAVPPGSSGIVACLAPGQLPTAVRYPKHHLFGPGVRGGTATDQPSLHLRPRI